MTGEDDEPAPAPVTYMLASGIPGAIGYDLDDVDRIIPHTFEYGNQRIGLVINGTGEPKSKVIGDADGDGAVMLPIYAGSVLVIVDGTPMVTVTPSGGEWFIDPFEGGKYGPDHPVDQSERFLLEALHNQLLELGEDLPPLEDLADEYTDDVDAERGDQGVGRQ